MRRITIIGPALAVAVAVSAAGASAMKTYPSLEKQEDGHATVLYPPQPVEGTSGNAVFTTPAGDGFCERVQWVGTLLSNGRKTDRFDITRVTTESCTSTITCLGNPTVTAEPPEGKPWLGTLGTDGTIKLTGPVNFTAKYPPGPCYSPAPACTWQTPKLKSTFNTEGPIDIATSDQKFKLDKEAESNSACPKTGILSATWALTTSLPDTEQTPVFLG
jgi:hypothetical protein